MREILFRAKTYGDQKWVYGYLVKKPQAASWGDHGGPWYIDVTPADPDDNYKSYNVDPDTVGQYIGLTDTNGKKIFEGDIVKSTVEVGCFVVAYRPEIACYAGNRINNLQAFEKWVFLYENSEKNLTVIGNMHDNPELKEETEDDLR